MKPILHADKNRKSYMPQFAVEAVMGHHRSVFCNKFPSSNRLIKQVICGISQARMINKYNTEARKKRTMISEGAREGSTELYTASFGNT